MDATHELERVAQRGLLGGSTRLSADLHGAQARRRSPLRHVEGVTIPERRDETWHLFAPLARRPARSASDVPETLAKHSCDALEPSPGEALQAPRRSDGPRLERGPTVDDLAAKIVGGSRDRAIGSRAMIAIRVFRRRPIGTIARVGVLEIGSECRQRGVVHELTN